MADDDRAELARSWHRYLEAQRALPPNSDSRELLRELIDRAAAHLSADPFDPGAGVEFGAALRRAGLVSAAAPIASAPVLLALAEHLGRPGAARTARYLAAVGQGHCVSIGQHRDERAARIQLLFDRSVAAMAVMDTEGAVVQANPGFADMVGRAPDAVAGITVFDFTHPTITTKSEICCTPS